MGHLGHDLLYSSHLMLFYNNDPHSTIPKIVKKKYFSFKFNVSFKNTTCVLSNHMMQFGYYKRNFLDKLLKMQIVFIDTLYKAWKERIY